MSPNAGAGGAVVVVAAPAGKVEAATEKPTTPPAPDPSTGTPPLGTSAGGGLQTAGLKRT